MTALSESLAVLTRGRELSDSVLVGYSGGKDSMVVLDMCVNTFKRVEAFMMEFVPGMPMNDERCAYAKSRWGVTVRRGYPDPSGVTALNEGIFCDPPNKPGKPLHFFLVVIFKDSDARTAFCTAHGLDDNRYQSGAAIEALIAGDD